MTKLARDLEIALTRDSINLRRWYVEQAILKGLYTHSLTDEEPTPKLMETCRAAPSPEHQGIAHRMVFHAHKRPDLVLSLPDLKDPKSWNVGPQMGGLVLWLFEPWNEFRYDPNTETVHECMHNGQWNFHGKGQSSDNVINVYCDGYLAQMKAIGFATILEALVGKGLLPDLVPSNYGFTDASDMATALQLSEASFNKFVSRASAPKELTDQIRRKPIMFCDVSTFNSVNGLAAFGNGVVPTADIVDNEMTGDIIYPAGKLIPADREFMLSSAAGVAWPEATRTDDLIDLRTRIHSGMSDDTWADWMDGAIQYSDMVLTNRAPTYQKFLDHSFPTPRDRPPEERDAFLRLLGAAVFGSNMKLVAAMIGAPNAGKDTVIKWITMLLGGHQVGILSPMALTQNADDQRAFAPLKGARIAVVSGEVGEGRRAGLMAEKIKSITSGGGTMTVAEKYEKPTTIFFDGMLIMQGNSIPTIIGGDVALYKNRLVAVEFKHPFPLSSHNYDSAYRKEAPHFLQVLFLHYLDYVERGGGMMGVSPPESWTNFSDDVRSGADPYAWIQDCITQPNQATEIESPVLYRALGILSEKLGARALTAQRWSSLLKQAGAVLTKDRNTEWRTKVNRNDYRGWMLHFDMDASKSNGLFSDEDWQGALQVARMQSGSGV